MEKNYNRILITRKLNCRRFEQNWKYIIEIILLISLRGSKRNKSIFFVFSVVIVVITIYLKDPNKTKKLDIEEITYYIVYITNKSKLNKIP